MDIQFQPNQTLGRMLWSFSGNAYEIDECSLSNYEKYGLIDKENDNYVAKNVRSIKTGQKHTLVLTDYKNNNDERIQEIWTWGQDNKIPTKITLPEELKNDPIVSIACGDTKNLLITENCNVYQWTNEDYAITISSTNPIPKQ